MFTNLLLSLLVLVLIIEVHRLVAALQRMNILLEINKSLYEQDKASRT